MLKRDGEPHKGALPQDTALRSLLGTPAVLLPPPSSPSVSLQSSSAVAFLQVAPLGGSTNSLVAPSVLGNTSKPKSTTDPAPTALRIPLEPPGDNVKHAISNIHKSLKAKQRVINSREPLPKNASKISEFINKSPVNPTFPANKEGDGAPDRAPIAGLNTGPGTPTEPPKAAGKRKAKKGASKTDFFAAKLASAVDDMDSSDSDETFVYENNPSDEPQDTNPVQAPISHLSSLQSSPSAQETAPLPSVAAAQLPGTIPPLAGTSSRAQSIHSVLSRAPKSKASVQPTPTSASVSSSSYLENKRPAHQRSVSGYSTGPGPSEDKGHYTATNSIDQTSQYSFDEVETDLIDDDDSTEGEYFSNPMLDSSLTSVRENGKGDTQRAIQAKDATTASIASKNTSKKNCKSSVSSSKLRATTSKIFNKKGTQPRRYSIIPNDVDIEDFDDDLIYYDGSIRFPYGNPSSSYGLNESSSLLNGAHGKIPHYRSLNLNHKALPRASDKRLNKRYLSTGQPLAPPSEKNRDIFPFAYPDHSYYYDYDDLENGGNVHDHTMSPHNGNGQLSPLLHQKSSRRPSQRTSVAGGKVYFWRSLFYTLLSIAGILSVGFVMGFVLASTKDLTNVELANISDTLVSRDELVFNIEVTAFNPGWFTVEINEVELDVFAKSGYLEDDIFPEVKSAAVETVLLGTVYKLDPPMIFAGGIFSRDPVRQSGEVRLLSPGKNITGSMSSDNSTEPDNSKKWQVISKNPFDLIVRGTLKYNLPLSSDTRAVVVNKVGYVDPVQNT